MQKATAKTTVKSVPALIKKTVAPPKEDSDESTEESSSSEAPAPKPKPTGATNGKVLLA